MRNCSREYKYTPRYNGNRDAADDERFFVVVQGLSPGLSVELQGLQSELQRLRTGADDAADRAAKVYEVQRALVDGVAEKLVSAHNYKHKRRGELVEASSVDEFMRAADQELINEILAFMIAPVSEEDLANLEEPTSGS